MLTSVRAGQLVWTSSVAETVAGKSALNVDSNASA